MVVLSAVMFLQSTVAQIVTLGWDPSTNTDVVGYKVYYGGVSGNYTNSIVMGNVTAVTISNLASGATYYFAATAYNSSGVESRFSNQAIYSVPSRPSTPPTLNPINNVLVNENASTQTVTLNGINPGNGSSTFTISAASSNTKVIANPIVNYTNSNNTGALLFAPLHNVTGSAIITVTANNHAASNNITVQTFSVSVYSKWAPPKITMQPTNIATVVGKTVKISVTTSAAGGTVPIYQWQYNSVNLPKATSATLTLTNVTLDSAGTYSVSISNSGGLTNSYPATLSVYATPAASLVSTVRSGSGFGFAVSGVPGYKYAVQASTNMVNWISLKTNIAPFSFVDTNASRFSKRFYRSVYLQ